jgi:hypothetical protein
MEIKYCQKHIPKDDSLTQKPTLNDKKEDLSGYQACLNTVDSFE